MRLSGRGGRVASMCTSPRLVDTPQWNTGNTNRGMDRGKKLIFSANSCRACCSVLLQLLSTHSGQRSFLTLPQDSS